MGKGRPQKGQTGPRKDHGKTWTRPRDENEAMERLKMKENDDGSDSSEDENHSENSSSSENDEKNAAEVEVPFQVAMWDVRQVLVFGFLPRDRTFTIIVKKLQKYPKIEKKPFPKKDIKNVIQNFLNVNILSQNRSFFCFSICRFFSL